MYFNRYEAKLAAKASMKQAQPSYMVVMLVYLLLTTGLTQLVMSLVGVPWASAMTYLQQGYTPEKVFDYVILQQMDRVAIAGGAELLLDLFCAVVEFGLISYTLRLARNEGSGIANLFDGFAKAGRVIWLNILTALLVFLWTALFTVPAFAILVAVILSEADLSVLMLLYFALIFGAVALGIWVAYRYYLTCYILLDDPNCTARQSLRLSKTYMKGHKGEAVILDLSFFGWAMLAGLLQSGFMAIGLGVVGIIASGVFQLWLTPYVLTTRANFYNYVIGLNGGGIRPSGSYAGPDYEYHSNDGPTPF